MPKIPTLQTQAPGSRPIVTDIVRGGGEEYRAKGKAAQGWAKAFAKIASVFDIEDRERDDNEVNAVLADKKKEIDNIRISHASSGKSIVPMHASFDAATKSYYDHEFDPSEFSDPESAKTAKTRLQTYLLKSRQGLEQIGLSNFAVNSQNLVQGKVRDFISDAGREGFEHTTTRIYGYRGTTTVSTSLLAPKKHGSKYLTPNMGTILDEKLTELEKKAPDGLSLEEKEFLIETDLVYKHLVTWKQNDKGNWEAQNILDSLGDTISPEIKKRAGKIIARGTFSSLISRWDMALTASEGNPKLLAELNSYVKDDKGKEVFIEDPFLKSDRKVTQIGYLKILLENNREILDYKTSPNAKETIYQGLKKEVDRIHSKYIVYREALEKPDSAVKLAASNELYLNLIKQYAKVDAATSAFGKDTSREGLKFDDPRALRLKLGKISAEIENIMKTGKRNGVVINVAPFIAKANSLKKYTQDQLTNVLSDEIDKYFSASGKTPVNEKRFRTALMSNINGLNFANRKSIIGYFELRANPKMPAGLKNQMTAAEDRMASEYLGISKKFLNDRSGSVVTAFHKMKRDLWNEMAASDWTKDPMTLIGKIWVKHKKEINKGIRKTRELPEVSNEFINKVPGVDRLNAYYDKVSAAGIENLKPQILKKNINRYTTMIKRNINDLKDLAKNPSKLGLPKYDRVRPYFESLGGSSNMTRDQRIAVSRALKIKMASVLAYVESIKLGLAIK